MWPLIYPRRKHLLIRTPLPKGICAAQPMSQRSGTGKQTLSPQAMAGMVTPKLIMVLWTRPPKVCIPEMFFANSSSTSILRWEIIGIGWSLWKLGHRKGVVPLMTEWLYRKMRKDLGRYPCSVSPKHALHTVRMQQKALPTPSDIKQMPLPYKWTFFFFSLQMTQCQVFCDGERKWTKSQSPMTKVQQSGSWSSHKATVLW